MEQQDPRVYLAAERTFLAWIRTGLSLMGFGFLAARFGLFLREELSVNVSNPRHGGLSLPVGVTLLALGVIVIVGSGVRYRRYLRGIDAGNFGDVFGTSFALFIVVTLAIIGIALAVYLTQI